MRQHFTTQDLVWALGSLCQTHHRPFDAKLTIQQYPGLEDLSTFQRAARAHGFKVSIREASIDTFHDKPQPFMAILQADATQNLPGINKIGAPPKQKLALIIRADKDRILYLESGQQTATMLPIADFKH